MTCNACCLLALIAAGCQSTGLPGADAAIDADVSARDLDNPPPTSFAALDMSRVHFTSDGGIGDPCDDNNRCANGCCDATRHCANGTDNSSCGTAGRYCLDCSANQTTVGGNDFRCRPITGGGMCGCQPGTSEGCEPNSECDPLTQQCYLEDWCWRINFLPACSAYVTSHLAYWADFCPWPSAWPPRSDSACGVSCVDCTLTGMTCSAGDCVRPSDGGT